VDILSDIISLLIWVLVGWPFCLMLHESGHASMILLLTKQKVTFQFGVRGTKREFQWGRLSILMYFELSALFFCRYRLENKANLSRFQDFWITVGGPLASLLFTILFGALWLGLNTVDPWRGLAIFNLVSFLSSIIPRYNDRWQGVAAGIPNDGLQLVQLIQQVNEDKNGGSHR
jgi:hypothetical protein